MLCSFLCELELVLNFYADQHLRVICGHLLHVLFRVAVLDVHGNVVKRSYRFEPPSYILTIGPSMDPVLRHIRGSYRWSDGGTFSNEWLGRIRIGALWVGWWISPSADADTAWARGPDQREPPPHWYIPISATQVHHDVRLTRKVEQVEGYLSCSIRRIAPSHESFWGNANPAIVRKTAGTEQKAQHLKEDRAVLELRKVIQILAKATPENLHEVQKELDDCMREHLEDTGLQKERIKKESDKCLDEAIKRIEKSNEEDLKRKKEQKDRTKSESDKCLQQAVKRVEEQKEAGGCKGLTREGQPPRYGTCHVRSGSHR
ncbi:hypothetical protein AK812_SmicGene8849 [Symbiodinium microadriaticum]|uniref:Uncharacterized protein n=1 Tax=Symbiodinium microadriaticum TaxID=2951 RepID=A0A1Q9EJX1_SYMMI|nr:hypothetical protein AK812_SmicGene8849 [Symbiodinium microadriaticum]